MGITEVLTIIDILKNGSIIGHRLYSSEEESDIKSRIMSREEFIELAAKHVGDDEK